MAALKVAEGVFERAIRRVKTLRRVFDADHAGEPRKKTMRACGIGETTHWRWRDEFEKRGPEALLDRRNRSGRKPRVWRLSGSPQAARSNPPAVSTLADPARPACANGDALPEIAAERPAGESAP